MSERRCGQCDNTGAVPVEAGFMTCPDIPQSWHKVEMHVYGGSEVKVALGFAAKVEAVAVAAVQARLEALAEAARWLLICHDNVIAGKPVRGLGEAWEGLRRTLARYAEETP